MCNQRFVRRREEDVSRLIAVTPWHGEVRCVWTSRHSADRDGRGSPSPHPTRSRRWSGRSSTSLPAVISRGEIAASAALRLRTVDYHLTNLRRKASARTTSGLMHHALREGWLPLPHPSLPPTKLPVPRSGPLARGLAGERSRAQGSRRHLRVNPSPGSPAPRGQPSWRVLPPARGRALPSTGRRPRTPCATRLARSDVPAPSRWRRRARRGG